MAAIAQLERRPALALHKERGDLLQGDAPEPGAEGALTHPAVEHAAVALQGSGIEHLAVLAREEEGHLPQPAVLDFGEHPLDHEGRVLRLEPVPLALAHGQVLPLGGAGHRQQEEAQGGRVDDLAPVVEDATLAVDAVAIFPRAQS